MSKSKRDPVAREEELSSEARLRYHQTHSQPAMERLKEWLQRQFDDKLVERNSSLGEAINYLLKRWDAMTLFLRQARAPLDNNICESVSQEFDVLQNPHRSPRWRHVHEPDYSCELSGANAFDYLNQLQRNANEVAKNPECWQPWNYRQQVVKSKAA